MNLPIHSALRHSCLLLACLWLSAALAQTPAAQAYLQDSQGDVAHNAFGTCWRTGSWTAEQALLGCDGVLQPPVAKMTAPPVMVVVQPPAAAAPVAPTPCTFSLVLAGDDSFAFDSTRLSPAAQQHLEQTLARQLPNCKNIETIMITGHADRLGTASYNQKLSEKRAQIVADFLTRQVPAARITPQGMGARQPLVRCDETMRQTALIACLAPNRRVAIEMRGSHSSP